MEVEAGFVAASLLIILLNKWRRRRLDKQTSVWVKEWINRRKKYGAYHSLMKELTQEDISSYKNYVRMHVSTFEELLQKVAPIMTRQDTHMRDAILE